MFNTGRMRAPHAFVYAGGSWTKQSVLDMAAFVVEHPTQGLVLFDTGLNSRARTDADLYLGWLAAQVTSIDEEGAELPDLMLEAGLEPADVRMIVLSHMHYDHTGTLEAFPNATVVVSERERLAAGQGFINRSAVVEGDYDGITQWRELDYTGGRPFATFVSHHDLLGDGSVVAVDLRGHTAGSQGLVVRAPGAPILLAGDAVWVEESWRYPAKPSFAHDMALWWEQVWRIKKFSQLEPSLIVVPGHDLAVLDRYDSVAMVRHDLQAETVRMGDTADPDTAPPQE